MPKKVEITEEQRNMVRQLSGYGITQDQICSLLDISRNTLTKYCSPELHIGKAQANAKVAANLFKQATEGNNITASIFWLKCQAGWKDTSTIEVINAESDDSKFRKLVTGLQQSKLKAKERGHTIN
tara:strand:+ start:386 stop:763 length:378 start_codon:yes stop_codon:yes gene_type:complete